MHLYDMYEQCYFHEIQDLFPNIVDNHNDKQCHIMYSFYNQNRIKD